MTRSPPEQGAAAREWAPLPLLPTRTDRLSEYGRAALRGAREIHPGDRDGRPAPVPGEAIWLEAVLPTAARVRESLGLAYTSDSGEVLTIEATIARGRGELVITSQLGDVM